MDDLGLAVGSPLVISLKQRVVTLATKSGVMSSVQKAAQSCLNSGWLVVLPTAEERAKTLSELLPKEESADVAQVPAGCRFMIELLVNSLMTDGGLEMALDMSIQVEGESGLKISPSITTDGTVVPLMQLVEQLLTSSTTNVMAHITELSQRFQSNQPHTSRTRTDLASLDLLLQFQRLLFGKLLTFSDTGQLASGMQSLISVW